MAKTVDLKKLKFVVETKLLIVKRVGFCNFVTFILYYSRFHCHTLCVHVCVCPCAFISFYRKGLLLSKLMSKANINVQVSDIILRTLAYLLLQNFPHLRLHLQNSEIPAQLPAGIKLI